ncbi:hypothetical protein Tco_0317957 [Tanacetum coccineum]
MLAPQVVEGEGSGKPTEPQHTPTTTSPSNEEPILNVASSSQPKKTYTHRKTKRKATEISQSSRPTILVAYETAHEERGDSMERAATTSASLDAEQDSGNIAKSQSMAALNEPIPQGTSSSSGPRRQDTILGDRPAQTKFESLDTDLRQTKQVYGAAYTKLIMKVKKLEKTVKSSQAKRRARVVISDDEDDLEDPSK